MRWLALVVLGGSLALAACSSDDEPSGGGNAGSGGASGSAGSAGDAGTAGSASGGSGGGAGSGGSAGNAGSGGNAGNAGSSGSAGSGGGCSQGTLVFESDFEAQSMGALWVDGDATISSSQAHSGSYSALYVFSGAGHFGLTDLSAFDEAYVEMWVYLDDMPCISGCDSAGKHFFRFAWWPDKNGGIQKQIDTGMLNGQLGAFSFGFGVPTVSEWKDYGSAVQSGTWQRVRTAFRANAPGAADGRFVWMFDDTVVLDISGEYVVAGESLDTFMFTNYDIVPGDGLTAPKVHVDDWTVRTGPGSFDCLQP
jgi:hypothetical protein